MELKITNRQGETFIVYYDIQDHQKVIERSWYIKKQRKNRYVASTNGKETIRMHRHFLGITDNETVVTHKDGNGLNNYRGNIEVCSLSLSRKRKKVLEGSSSKYLGVSYSKSRKKFISQIKVEGKSIYLGDYINEIDAAKAYDKAAIKYFGNLANPNFKSPSLSKH